MKYLGIVLLTPCIAFGQGTYIYDTTSNNSSTTNNTNANTNLNTNVNTSVNTNVNTSVNTNVSTSTSDVNSVSEVTTNNRSTSTAVNYNVQSGTATNNNVNSNYSESFGEMKTEMKTTGEMKNINENRNTDTVNATNYNNSYSEGVVDQTIRTPPPSAMAPSMMSYSQDVCASGVSGAVQTQILGLSVGRQKRDENCERIKLSKTLYDMGMRVASVSLLCQDERVWNSMMMAGTPCPYEGLIGDEAKQAWLNNPDKVPGNEKNH
jgi:hypothetical protein